MGTLFELAGEGYAILKCWNLPIRPDAPHRHTVPHHDVDLLALPPNREFRETLVLNREDIHHNVLLGRYTKFPIVFVFRFQDVHQFSTLRVAARPTPSLCGSSVSSQQFCYLYLIMCPSTSHRRLRDWVNGAPHHTQVSYTVF